MITDYPLGPVPVPPETHSQLETQTHTQVCSQLLLGKVQRAADGGDASLGPGAVSEKTFQRMGSLRSLRHEEGTGTNQTRGKQSRQTDPCTSTDIGEHGKLWEWLN